MATVLHAEAEEGADKLLRLRVDIGSEQRTIFAGIRQSYRSEDLIGKQVIVVANVRGAVGFSQHDILHLLTARGQ